MAPILDTLSLDRYKHQNLYNWIHIFEHAGFRRFDLPWSPFRLFLRSTAKCLVQYITNSRFARHLRVTEILPIQL